MADRLKQISSHVTGNFPQGMLKDEVAIITGTTTYGIASCD